ncbi:hypothetical protein QYM36_013106 [Artemia franciscana]|uniref:Reverse transcriptase domain-containing protein n=1 Tax=Artemia franciscana TaxID=6661 RepID=A0AA88HHJ8_ARTSF|nr:hypothetical protein QYM36_013106 [Artemia franciscana]
MTKSVDQGYEKATSISSLVNGAPGEIKRSYLIADYFRYVGDATLNMAVKWKNPFNAINLEKPTKVIKQAKSRINVGCRNVTSVKQEATQAFLVHEMDKYNIEILCISETRISCSGSIVITAPETLHQFQFFYSVVEDNSGLHGVGFIMNQRTRNSLLEWEPVSCRLARIRLKGNPANVSIISTYAPTREATEMTKDDFYGKLQQLSSSIAADDYLIVAGHFNARVGPSDQTSRQILGKFGQGHRCENGQSHLLTLHSNDGVTKAQIGFILVRQRWRSSLQDSSSFNGADTGSQSGSDHRLFAAKIVLRLATLRKNKPEVGFDVGRVLSPTLFNYCIDWVLENALLSHPGLQIGQNLSLTDLYYADDVGLLSDPIEVQNMIDSVVVWADLIGLKVSTEKTKFMAINHDTGPFPLTVNQVHQEKVNHNPITKIIVNLLKDMEVYMHRYFPNDIDTQQWICNPFSIEMEEINFLNLKAQEEFAELTSGTTLRLRFSQVPVHEFWIEIKSEYPYYRKWQ